MRRVALVVFVFTAFIAFAHCTGEGSGEAVRVRVPRGASFGQVADSLEAKEIIAWGPLFRLYARAKGAASRIQPGTYEFRRGSSWDVVLDDLVAGRFLVATLTIPEGWDLRGIAPRVAEMTGVPEDSVLIALADTTRPDSLDVPGPTLEGYLYPATYTFPVDAPLDTILHALVRRYKQAWTAERRARADSIGMDEREVITLASIIEKEAKKVDEMPLISAVFHNRLEIGYPLQADATVQYALGVHRERLLYAAIDSAAGDPYNTYHHTGLPPGPIASPSGRAIDAALGPDTASGYLYFVARPDGSHVFSRSLEEHNRARAELRRARQAADTSDSASREPDGP